MRVFLKCVYDVNSHLGANNHLNSNEMDKQEKTTQQNKRYTPAQLLMHLIFFTLKLTTVKC